jgi:uncharacterized protein YndB with AHSA1/START domain
VTEPLEFAFDVACTPEHAFDVWAVRTSQWWPTDHTMSGERGLTVTIEPRPGGRIVERAPSGAEHDWGEVLVWEPPSRLAYLWHLGSDRRDATEVEVRFASTAVGTTVTVVHSGWERLGASAGERRGRNQAGWAGLLPRYRDACAAV